MAKSLKLPEVQTVEKVVEVPQVGQTMQGTTREVDIPLAPRREDRGNLVGILHPLQGRNFQKDKELKVEFQRFFEKTKVKAISFARSTLPKWCSRLQVLARLISYYIYISLESRICGST